jgi:hypothetical protein
MSSPGKQGELEIAHVLFIDIVGYSKLLSDKQRERFQLLNELIRNTAQFRAADAAGNWPHRNQNSVCAAPVPVATYCQIIVSHWQVLALTGSFTK